MWSGPEGRAAATRDTAVVLRSLFESARKDVLLAGYSFSHGAKLLAPLHAVMQAYEVKATFIVDIKQAQQRTEPPELHAHEQLAGFISTQWRFGPPYPALYYDRRSLTPGWEDGVPWVSQHAKCVVVDGERALISSANFTQRGQERNLEVGVLLHDPRLAEHLAGQWRSLIAGGHVLPYQPEPGE